MQDELTNRPHPWITLDHLRRLAVIYLRQSTKEQGVRVRRSEGLQKLKKIPEPKLTTPVSSELSRLGLFAEGPIHLEYFPVRQAIALEYVRAVFPPISNNLSRPQTKALQI
jgi:hypothetical protein